MSLQLTLYKHGSMIVVATFGLALIGCAQDKDGQVSGTAIVTYKSPDEKSTLLDDLQVELDCKDQSGSIHNISTHTDQEGGFGTMIWPGTLSITIRGVRQIYRTRPQTSRRVKFKFTERG